MTNEEQAIAQLRHLCEDIVTLQNIHGGDMGIYVVGNRKALVFSNFVQAVKKLIEDIDKEKL